MPLLNNSCMYLAVELHTFTYHILVFSCHGSGCTVLCRISNMTHFQSYWRSLSFVVSLCSQSSRLLCRVTEFFLVLAQHCCSVLRLRSMNDFHCFTLANNNLFLASIINPRCTCAARVTVLGLCVQQVSQKQYQWVQCHTALIYKQAIFMTPLRSKIMV